MARGRRSPAPTACRSRAPRRAPRSPALHRAAGSRGGPTRPSRPRSTVALMSRCRRSGSAGTARRRRDARSPAWPAVVRAHPAARRSSAARRPPPRRAPTVQYSSSNGARSQEGGIDGRAALDQQRSHAPLGETLEQPARLLDCRRARPTSPRREAARPARAGSRAHGHRPGCSACAKKRRSVGIGPLPAISTANGCGGRPAAARRAARSDRQPRVEVVGTERAGAARHGVVGDAVDGASGGGRRATRAHRRCRRAAPGHRCW